MFGEFTLLFIALAAIILLLDVWAILSVYRSDKGVESKALWSLGIALFPVIGLVVWACWGRVAWPIHRLHRSTARAEQARARELSRALAMVTRAAGR